MRLAAEANSALGTDFGKFMGDAARRKLGQQLTTLGYDHSDQADRTVFDALHGLDLRNTDAVEDFVNQKLQREDRDAFRSAFKTLNESLEKLTLHEGLTHAFDTIQPDVAHAKAVEQIMKDYFDSTKTRVTVERPGGGTYEYTKAGLFSYAAANANGKAEEIDSPEQLPERLPTLSWGMSTVVSMGTVGAITLGLAALTGGASLLAGGLIEGSVLTIAGAVGLGAAATGLSPLGQLLGAAARREDNTPLANTIEVGTKAGSAGLLAATAVAAFGTVGVATGVGLAAVGVAAVGLGLKAWRDSRRETNSFTFDVVGRDDIGRNVQRSYNVDWLNYYNPGKMDRDTEFSTTSRAIKDKDGNTVQIYAGEKPDERREVSFKDGALTIKDTTKAGVRLVTIKDFDANAKGGRVDPKNVTVQEWKADEHGTRRTDSRADYVYDANGKYAPQAGEVSMNRTRTERWFGK